MSARQWQLLLDGDRDDVTVLGQVQTGFELVILLRERPWPGS